MFEGLERDGFAMAKEHEFFEEQRYAQDKKAMTILDTFALGRQHGVSGACLHPLLLLIEDSPSTPFRLAQDIGCTPANVTGLLDRLEDKGWVTRNRDRRDRRQCFVTPTERAFEVFSQTIKP
jgi:DNA-binding MarR family transcriptional regulator